jgi:hypothetical protein
MSVLDKTIGDGLKQGAFKIVPTGRYVLRVVDYEVRKAGDKEVVDLKVKVQAPLDDQNIDGVNLDKRLALAHRCGHGPHHPCHPRHQSRRAGDDVDP